MAVFNNYLTKFLKFSQLALVDTPLSDPTKVGERANRRWGGPRRRILALVCLRTRRAWYYGRCW